MMVSKTAALRREVTGEWALALSALLGLLSAVLMYLLPSPAAAALLETIRLYAFTAWFLLVVLEMQMRRYQRRERLK